mgnify:CR=1 FL=1
MDRALAVPSSGKSRDRECIIEDAYGDTPPPPVSGFLTTAVTVDMEGVELSVKRKSLI